MILGIDLGGTNIRIGQVEYDRVVNKIAAPSPSRMSLIDSLDYLINMIRGMITPDVEGIGIGVPSVLDITKGIVYNVTNIPAWKEVYLKDILYKEFQLPVFINNDSNCFVLGEKHHGVGKRFKDITGVTLGTGVGAGVIVNHELYGGRNTGAGEIGSLPYLDANFEYYCSSEFFIKQYNTTGKAIAEQALSGNEQAQKIWDEFGTHIGNLIQAILYVYDSELIIFGGGIAEAFPLFEKQIWETIHLFPYPETIKNVRIEISKNNDISILGAAALVSNNVCAY